VYKRKFDEVLKDAHAQLEEGEPGDGDGAPAMPASSSADGTGAEDAGPAASAAAAAEVHKAYLGHPLNETAFNDGLKILVMQLGEVSIVLLVQLIQTSLGHDVGC
jgi:hypothetical protein